MLRRIGGGFSGEDGIVVSFFNGKTDGGLPGGGEAREEGFERVHFYGMREVEENAGSFCD